VPAKLAIHVPTQAVAIHVLADGTDLTLGRSPDNDCVLAHDSVSRRHARIAHTSEGRWRIEDIGSKNGIRVEGHRIAAAELERNQWIAIGDVFCEFELLDSEAVEHLNARAKHRRESSHLWMNRLSVSSDVGTLMEDLLAGIVDIADCHRGFLLVVDDRGDLRVRARHCMDPDDFEGVTFLGSRSAVERSILERRPVYFSDKRDHTWLKDRESVIARGIRALASVPLEHEGKLLGVAYTDTDKEAKVFTDLDAELLGAFTKHASAVLAAGELHSKLAALELQLGERDRAGSRLAFNAVWGTQPPR
jgi:FHA domain-containing protein/GAF domain-containing protein